MMNNIILGRKEKDFVLKLPTSFELRQNIVMPVQRK